MYILYIYTYILCIYSDLTRNPMIVPLKILSGYHGNIQSKSSSSSSIQVLNIAFHPKQPWIFSCGYDGVINLFQDI